MSAGDQSSSEIEAVIIPDAPEPAVAPPAPPDWIGMDALPAKPQGVWVEFLFEDGSIENGVAWTEGDVLRCSFGVRADNDSKPVAWRPR